MDCSKWNVWRNWICSTILFRSYIVYSLKEISMRNNSLVTLDPLVCQPVPFTIPQCQFSETWWKHMELQLFVLVEIWGRAQHYEMCHSLPCAGSRTWQSADCGNTGEFKTWWEVHFEQGFAILEEWFWLLLFKWKLNKYCCKPQVYRCLSQTWRQTRYKQNQVQWTTLSLWPGGQLWRVKKTVTCQRNGHWEETMKCAGCTPIVQICASPHQVWSSYLHQYKQIPYFTESRIDILDVVLIPFIVLVSCFYFLPDHAYCFLSLWSPAPNVVTTARPTETRKETATATETTTPKTAPTKWKRNKRTVKVNSKKMLHGAYSDSWNYVELLVSWSSTSSHLEHMEVFFLRFTKKKSPPLLCHIVYKGT